MRRPLVFALPCSRRAVPGAAGLLTADVLALGGTRAAAQPPAAPPVLGRWDLQVMHPDGSVRPSWLELSLSGRRTLVGRFVGEVGSARPIGRATFADGTLRFAIPPQWEEDTADLRVEGSFGGDTLAGTLVTPGGATLQWTGRRAPALQRAEAPTWGPVERLFDGRSLAGWATQGGGANRWRPANGVLANIAAGANLMTERRFDDFQLHLEFRMPKNGNSGVYLRGRHEVQLEDSPRRPVPIPLDVGAVYGFLPPNAHAARLAGVWQTLDVTLVGRRVTVALNGQPVIVDQVIPGITGGALDSDEGAPGPLVLQGDHGPVEYRNVVLTPAR